MDLKKQVAFIIDRYVKVRGGDKHAPDVIDYIEIINEEVAILKNGDQLIFMVIGSNDFFDWVFNFMFRKRIVPYNGNNKKLKVHNGFYKAYQLIREKTHMYIKHKDIKSVVVHGHSHGAGIATLMAVDIQYNFPEIDLGCVLTGSPRVGNKIFKGSYDKRVPNTMLFRYANDPIARLPFKFMGYSHVSKEIAIDKVKKCKFIAIKDHMLTAVKAKRYLELYPV